MTRHDWLEKYIAQQGGEKHARQIADACEGDPGEDQEPRAGDYIRLLVGPDRRCVAVIAETAVDSETTEHIVGAVSAGYGLGWYRPGEFLLLGEEHLRGQDRADLRIIAASK